MKNNQATKRRENHGAEEASCLSLCGEGRDSEKDTGYICNSIDMIFRVLILLKVFKEVSVELRKAWIRAA
ncbi:MAG: hypothetical protein ACUVUS_03195 [Thermoproteota archaeon]